MYASVDGIHDMSSSQHIYTNDLLLQYQPVYGIRSTPRIQQFDLSSNFLRRIREVDRTTFYPMTPSAEQLKTILEEYTSLKVQVLSKTNEIKSRKDQLKALEETIQKITAGSDAMLDYGTYAIIPPDQYKPALIAAKEMKDTALAMHNSVNQTLVNELEEFEFELVNLNDHLATYVEFLKLGIKEALGPDVNHNTCNICWEGEIKECISPCGHTFCSGCLDKLNDRACPTCRQTIEKRIRLFL